jgi:hypothetical protein
MIGSGAARPADTLANASATNATATATVNAPPAGTANYVCGVSATFSAAGTALCQLKDGATVVQQWYVTNTAPLQITYANPLKMTPATATTLVLAAGGAAVVGAVSISAYQQ